MAQTALHNPVLVNEVVDAMNLEDGKIIVDGTLGLGGYSEAVLKRGKNVKILAFDLDERNMGSAQERLAGFGGQVTYYPHNFAEMKTVLEADGITSIDGLMLDLGLASTQVDNAERGFSFIKDGELDMRFDARQSLTAAEVVNTYSLDRLIRIFRQYGEEPKAKRIALAIVERRRTQKFQTTLDLAALAEKVLGPKKGKIHPATRIFQALRIEVNRELESLQQVLADSLSMLSVSGRIAVVSYHSLEDRIVKNFFRDNSREYVNLPDQLTTTYLEPALKIITKKPVVPSAAEVTANSRSRSAKLRVAEKL